MSKLGISKKVPVSRTYVYKIINQLNAHIERK
jgi:hypothetical protein